MCLGVLYACGHGGDVTVEGRVTEKKCLAVFETCMNSLCPDCERKERRRLDHLQAVADPEAFAAEIERRILTFVDQLD